jgi:hypothetical protein
MPTIEETHSKVQRLLQANLNQVEIDGDNDFVVRHESAVVFVSVQEGFGEGGTVVRVYCPLVTGVEITPELCFWVATDGQDYRIGRTMLVPAPEGGTGAIYFSHSMVSDDLDESELMHGVFAVAYSSDKLDNELQNKFGGELFGPES